VLLYYLFYFYKNQLICVFSRLFICDVLSIGVYVNDIVCAITRVLRSEERKCVVRFGGLVIHNIGQLLPVQIHSGCFNTSEYVYPVSV